MSPLENMNVEQYFGLTINISIVKKLFIAIACITAFASCSDSKDFYKQNSEVIHAEPYGWMTTDEKIEGVTYKVNKPNAVLSVIFSETIVAPLLITGLDLFEPVSYEEQIESK